MEHPLLQNVLLLVAPDPTTLDREITRSDKEITIILGSVETELEEAKKLLSLLQTKGAERPLFAAYRSNGPKVMAVTRKAFDQVSGFPEDVATLAEALESFWDRLITDRTLPVLKVS